MYILYNSKDKVVAISDYFLEMLGVNSLLEFISQIGDINRVFLKCDDILVNSKAHYTQALKYGAVKNKKVLIKSINKNIAYELSVKELVSREEMLCLVEFHKVSETEEFDKAALMKSRQIGISVDEYKGYLFELSSEFKLFLTSDFTMPHNLTNIATYLKLDKVAPLLAKIDNAIDSHNIDLAKEISNAVGDYLRTIERLVENKEVD